MFATSCVIFFLIIRLVTFLLPWQQEVTVYLLPPCVRLHFLGDGDAGGCGEESNAGGRSADQEVQGDPGLHPAQLQDRGGAGEQRSGHKQGLTACQSTAEAKSKLMLTR